MTKTTNTHPPYPKIRIDVLRRGDEVLEASNVMADAFADSPSYNVMLSHLDQTTNQRRDALQWLFYKNINLMIDRCPTACKCVRLVEPLPSSSTSSTLDDGSENQEENQSSINKNEPVVGKMVAAFLWTPEEHEEIDLWTVIRYGGLLEMPFRLGWKGFLNLLSALDVFKKMWQEVSTHQSKLHPDAFLPSSKWITLERMTVIPQYQGQGIGSQALQLMVDEADCCGHHVKLSTQEHRNVRFYCKLGFEIVDERDMVQDEEGSYHTWTLVRYAKSSS
mmetsp:Transcript_60616/g.148711  ORF Transcript_60616/g.148711 Transcript_60616/m.148711 type:complete len:277 (+) Transcript_60616:1154-1984(+)|eukprot:CAMPEP_0113447342 /NCGR_PEP_ID=MMETSP0014_2-20120614/4185_1 /TAXON_ID=2857 /ORGANISM="Nitzschia sp." /LENGTH=276 /DNA_ID=CAMNT_0000338487 /DNA_START=1071 /DNA_END=1901 /DNA_ORIENTATION=- /assembly_acc=CAM_ASM_000159